METHRMQKEIFMKHTAVALAALVALTSVAGCAITPTLEEREQSFQALSLDHFRNGIDFVDDPLNPTINLNTRPGYQDYQFSFGPREDQFLRAMKFRETGDISLQGAVRLMRTGLRYPHASRCYAIRSSRHSRRAASRSDLNLALPSIFL